MAVRKPNRLKDYDYSQDGAYFVTICIQNRREILGKIIIGVAHEKTEASLDGIPYVALTETGMMVKQYIDKTPEFYNAVEIDNYVIMPNHIHMIIFLNTGTPVYVSPTKSMLPKIINAFKSLTSRHFGETMWQRSYYDRIIRNEEEYRKIWEYIDENPLNWETDKYFLKC